MPLHKNLTGTDLHEPKGLSDAAQYSVYQSNGDGTGTWTKELNLDTAVIGDITAPTASIDAVMASTLSTTGLATLESLELSTTVWDDLRVTLSSITGGGAPAAPGWVAIASTVYVRGFDTTTEESCEFTVQLPHSYKRGTDILPHVHWTASSAAAGNVVWAIEYIKIPTGSAGAGTSTTIKSDPTATPGAVRHGMITRINGTTGISGADLIESSIIACRFYRDTTNPNDTYAADALGLFVDFHYQVDKLGTLDEIPT